MKPGRDPSFVALCACLIDDRVSRKDAAVYACLLGHARGHSSRPSRKRIAQEARISEINVTRHTRRLSNCGYVTVTPSKGKHTNIYQLEALRRSGKASDTGVTPATVGGVSPATVEPDAYLGFANDTQLRAYEQQSKAKSVFRRSEQADAGRSPPSKGANRPGADAKRPQTITNNIIKTGSSAVASDSPYAAALGRSDESRSTADASAWRGNTDDLVEQLRRDFGSGQ